MSSEAKAVDLRKARGDDTRLQILDAARDGARRARGRGTTTRSIAERAGVQLSLVHYHFGGKQQLLAAVLDRENERLLERQRQLFAGPDSLAEKWRAACAYLREDVGSGYVRILWELWAGGLADAGARGALASGDRRVARAPDEGGGGVDGGARLELPIPPRALAMLVGNAFQGAEAEILAGIDEQEAPHHEALESVAT